MRSNESWHSNTPHITFIQQPLLKVLEIMLFALVMWYGSASGMSIETVFYVRLTKVVLHGVKRQGPVSRFGLKLD